MVRFNHFYPYHKNTKNNYPTYCRPSKKRQTQRQAVQAGRWRWAGVWVKPNGSNKVWRFSFNGENGKPQTLTLGAYPLFSLVQAREWRDEQKRKLALGQNIKRVKVRTVYTLEKIAREWHEKWRKGMAEKYTVQVMRNFERYIFPVIGNRDIRQIKTIDVVECLRIMERRGIADSLRKTKNSLNLVFSYAVGSGLIEYNPVLQIGKQVFEKPKNQHMAALPLQSFHS